MEAYLKSAVVILALAFSVSPVLAQGDQQDPPAQQQDGGDRFRHPGPMHSMKPGEGQDRWGPRREGFDRGDRMGHRGFGRGAREFGLARLLDSPDIRQQLGITAEQAAKIRQQESDFRKAEIRNRADLQVKRIDLADLLAADKPDRTAIDSKLQEISASQLALQKSAIDYRLTMRDTLSPAQRDKLRQLISDRWRRGRGPAPPPPPGAGRRSQRGAPPAPNSQRPPQNPPPTNN